MSCVSRGLLRPRGGRMRWNHRGGLAVQKIGEAPLPPAAAVLVLRDIDARPFEHALATGQGGPRRVLLPQAGESHRLDEPRLCNAWRARFMAFDHAVCRGN